MSSSRVHTSFTGLSPPMAFATAAASPATSPFGVARRPKLPPASSVLTRTLVGGKPRVLATTCWSIVGTCEPAQKSQPSAPTRTTASSGSMGACATRVLEAVYEFPYLAHAPMEPLDAVERLHGRVREI